MKTSNNIFSEKHVDWAPHWIWVVIR